jgi:Lipopolysaccharide assembly protein A domain
MAKVKIFLLISITALLTWFIYENLILAPPIKLFGQEIFQLHISVIIMSSFLLGLIFGWLGHVGFIRNRRKSAELALREQQVQDAQEDNQQEETKK